jgi:hypothetical protein
VELWSRILLEKSCQVWKVEVRCLKKTQFTILLLDTTVKDPLFFMEKTKIKMIKNYIKEKNKVAINLNGRNKRKRAF